VSLISDEKRIKQLERSRLQIEISKNALGE
jgi:hypothetical protein